MKGIQSVQWKSLGRKQSMPYQTLPFYATVNERQKSTPRITNFTPVNHTRPSSTLHKNNNSIVSSQALHP
jgi:hypothetical protein